MDADGSWSLLWSWTRFCIYAHLPSPLNHFVWTLVQAAPSGTFNTPAVHFRLSPPTPSIHPAVVDQQYNQLVTCYQHEGNGSVFIANQRAQGTPGSNLPTRERRLLSASRWSYLKEHYVFVWAPQFTIQWRTSRDVHQLSRANTASSSKMLLALATPPRGCCMQDEELVLKLALEGMVAAAFSELLIGAGTALREHIVVTCRNALIKKRVTVDWEREHWEPGIQQQE